MRTLILGLGEIGNSLARVLKDYNPILKTKTKEKIDGIEIMHICFPFSKGFVKEVKRYQELYKPKYTVIHSTVPVGTSKILNSISSPCLGIHPYLEESMKTFIKWLGGNRVDEVADYFRRANVKVMLTDNSDTPELMKMLDTTHYGIEIEYVKDIKRQCDKYKVPFEAWHLWVQNYNQGYEKLGHPEYKKPDLIPIMKTIGGHCVLQNAKILKTRFTTLLKKLNPSK